MIRLPTRSGISRAATWVVAVLLLASAVGVALAAPLPPGGTFTDDDGNVHEANIEALAASGITQGCNPPVNDLFCPDKAVTRAQMATFLTRALDLPAAAGSFTDTAGNVHEANIGALAAAGITVGCNPPANDMFCPDKAVTRAQMATFLTRALDLPAAAGSFTDTAGNVHEANIGALAAAGITVGCNPPANDMFCPDKAVTRAQMATFLTRALDLTPIVPYQMIIPADVDGLDALAAGQVLAAAVSDATPVDFHVLVADTPREMYDLMCTYPGTAFGLVETLPYALAGTDCGIEASFTAARFGTDGFSSQFLVPSASTAAAISDLDGMSWSYSDTASVSSYIIPLGMMAIEGVAAGSEVEAGTHAAAAMAVSNGSVDFGTTWVGLALPGDVRALTTSPLVPHAAVAFGAQFPTALRLEVEAALVAAAATPAVWDPSVALLYDWDTIKPAVDSEWDWLRTVLAAANYSADDL